MQEYSSRRRWLQGCGAVVLAGLAGCTGNGDGDDREGNGGSIDDSGVGNGNEDEGGNGIGSEGTDNSADDGEQIAATGPESYAFEMHSSNEPEEGESISTTVTGRVTAAGDFYQHVKQNLQGTIVETELYHVDGTTYVVNEYGCQSAPGEQMEYSPYGDYRTHDAFSTEIGYRDPDGTTTLDGQEVYVYEYDYGGVVGGVIDDGFDDGGNELTSKMYVSTETGYLIKTEYRAVEDGVGVVESSSRLHSFGEEFSIDPPTNC